MWPYAVKFYGETQGWDEAKRVAAVCGKNFRRMATQCMEAAASPAEVAEAERKSKVKAEQIVDKFIKKR